MLEPQIRTGTPVAVSHAAVHDPVAARCDHLIERCHSFGQVDAKSENMTDREHLCRGVHGQFGMIDDLDPARSDNRAGADAVERIRQFGMAPKLRKQGNDQAGAPGPEQGEGIFDRVRQLDRNDRTGRQASRLELCGERGHRAVGLRIGEAKGRLSGDP